MKKVIKSMLVFVAPLFFLVAASCTTLGSPQAEHIRECGEVVSANNFQRQRCIEQRQDSLFYLLETGICDDVCQKSVALSKLRDGK